MLAYTYNPSSRKAEDSEFQTSLNYTARSCPENNNNNNHPHDLTFVCLSLIMPLKLLGRFPFFPHYCKSFD